MSLIEMVTVVAIVGIFISFFYSELLLNWQALDNYIVRADFGQELDQMVDSITQYGRQAHTINVVTTPATQATTTTQATPATQTATFLDPSGVTLAVYTIDSTGQFKVNYNSGSQVIAKDLDFINSSFFNGGNTNFLQANLALRGQIFVFPVAQSTSVEVYSRNQYETKE